VPGAPQVRVLGFALMGGVEVRRKKAKAIKGKRLANQDAIDDTRDAIEDARPAGRELDQP
jgi:hypothetical protein